MLVHNPVVSRRSSNALLASPALGTVRVGYFWGLDGLVSRLGGDPREILGKQGLDEQVFADPDNTMECMTAVNLLEYCSDALNDPLFGFHLAQLQEPNVFGCVIALAQSAPTLRQALKCLVEYIPVSASPECELDLVESKSGVAEFRWRTNIGFSDAVQTNYHGVLVILKTLQMLARGEFCPNYASLACNSARPDLEFLGKSLGCQVRDRSDHNAIVFSAAQLDRPLATSDRLLYTILSEGLAQVREASSGNYVERVRSCVRRELARGQCTVDDCAGGLGTSTRTLQKRLHRLGIRFSDIVCTERIKLAQHALSWSDRSLDEIAFQLGYSEQTSFGRAFKRATGLTPKAYRSAQRQEH